MKYELVFDEKLEGQYLINNVLSKQTEPLILIDE